MDVNLNIKEELLPNEEQFKNSFFSRFDLRERDEPLQLNDSIAKDYRFPTFYADSSCAIAIFHCDYEAAKAIMPHPSMEPVKMTKGRSLVIFSCYEYRNVMNVAPYNEIAVTIPVICDGARNIPILTMLRGDKHEKFGYYVFHMPVTSLENRIRGRKIWGLPKEVEKIDIQRQGGMCNVAASVDGQDPYLRLSIPTGGKPQDFDVRSNLYSILGNQRLTSQTQFKGTFNLTKGFGTLFKRSSTANGAAISLGQGPIADKLRALKIEQNAFQFRNADTMNACFDLAHDSMEL
ncbi:acetoacetate decarboxylase family protein [Flexibacterium corallicola]|uniref:acetoacetate decarboxylase family protein n=1 Tax=Flexibacterium corallicola TaxID=3037259 RepID=UPI00286F553F|nr:acetoacetate decarboxylase family protein [Pseudovibrio sp. M1P-2-3]